MDRQIDVLRDALRKNDPSLLTALPQEELEKLHIAEEILEARHAAHERASHLARLPGQLVGVIAVAGFLVNAYQSYENKQHLAAQEEREEARWKQEFDRTRRSDKYHAFFETSALVTDDKSADRRLIGLALLDEFVADPDYHQKAVAILDQSLARELKESASEPPVVGLSEGHRAAISEIVQALSASSSCHELQRAAESIDRVVNHAKYADPEENLELFTLYARRVVGRAVVVCKTPVELRTVRNPVRDALLAVGQIEDLPKNATKSDASRGVADLLVKSCQQEIADYGSHDCVDIRTHYQALCKDMSRDAVLWKKEQSTCELVTKWPAPPPDETPPIAALPE